MITGPTTLDLQMICLCGAPQSTFPMDAEQAAEGVLSLHAKLKTSDKDDILGACPVQHRITRTEKCSLQ